MLQTVKQHLQHLVSFPTISTNSNCDIVAYCTQVLTDAGFTCTHIPHPIEPKTNIVAIAGDRQKAGLLFSAHTDVVPVTGQNWTYPPFAVTDTGDKWYGRGTTDMKGYIAIVLTYAEKLAKSAVISGIPVSICLSYDEEIGCQGVPYAIKEFPNILPVKPAYCFVGEPTEMQPILGHKGKIAVAVNITGKPCHSSVCPDGINAIEIASNIIVYIRSLMDDCTIHGDQDNLSYPPHATLQTGRIQGGNALNIVPDSCTFEFEIRSSYQSEIDGLYTKVSDFITKQKRMYQTDIIHHIISAYPPLSTDANSPIKQLADRLTNHRNTPPQKVSFGTEGGLFAAYGIPTLICGVGNMDQGHKPDEYIAVSEIKKGMVFFKNVQHWIQGDFT